MSAPAENTEAPRNLAGRRLGRYEVITQLASGGMAAVYIARAQGVAGFERLVAIKVLHAHLAYEEEFISMFLDEARLAARIRHPNVVPTTDINDTGGDGYFLVMDYIEGDHLGGLLGRAAKAGKRLPTPLVSRIVLDALAGLAAAHELTDEEGNPMNLVHRDISPHNVMVGSDGIARLTDFGVAKAEVRMSSTRAGQFKGKLSYMAPEQASTGESTQVSDIFSMGIVLWETLTGRRLFRGQTNAQTLAKILQDPIPKPSEVWPDLEPFDAIVEKALARVPEERFQSANEFIDALEETALANGGIGTQRQVSQLVMEFLGDKIEAERERIREAISQLGQAGLGEATLPIPRDGSSSSITHSGARPVAQDQTLTGVTQSHLSMPTLTGSIALMPQEPQKRGGILVPLLLFLILIGIGALAFVLINRDDTPQVAPVIIEQPAAPGASSDDTIVEAIEKSAQDEAAEAERLAQEEAERRAAEEAAAAAAAAAEAEKQAEAERAASAMTRRPTRPVRPQARPAAPPTTSSSSASESPSAPAPSTSSSSSSSEGSSTMRPTRRAPLPSNPYGL